MKKFKDSSVEKIIQLKKYECLYEWTSLEVRVSLICTVFFAVLFPMTCEFGKNINSLKSIVSLYDNIGIAFIGYLGVIMAGLAMLISLISNKLYYYLKNKNAIQQLENLLYGYYMLVLLAAIQIVCSFIIHCICLLNIPITLMIFAVDWLVALVLFYLLIFTIFYTVKQIGVGLQLFDILNTLEQNIKRNKIT